VQSALDRQPAAAAGECICVCECICICNSGRIFFRCLAAFRMAIAFIIAPHRLRFN